MSAANKPLVDALKEREYAYAQAIERIDDDKVRHEMREAAELVRCLRRLVMTSGTAEIHAAFGAPGDFGYQTAIGAALASVYRG